MIVVSRSASPRRSGVAGAGAMTAGTSRAGVTPSAGETAGLAAVGVALVDGDGDGIGVVGASAASVRAARALQVAGGVARGGVPEIQRARILTALVEVALERGAGRVTVAHIVARSGVSRRTFYEFFADREACFVAAFEEAVARAAARVVPAFEQAGSWRERVRAGLQALLEFLDEEPGLGRLCVVDALGGGPRVLEHRARVLQALVDAVDVGRGEARAGLSPTRLTAEGAVGGALSVLYARLAERPLAEPSASQPPGVDTRGSGARAPVHAKPLVGLLAPLTAMVVLPYQGPAVARREAVRPAPRARRRRQPPRSNPLEGLEMRLTYRTIRVLSVIASSPKASNRQVADAAGIQDQGQISKLLARLDHLGLIENAGAGQPQGEPNAWHLTRRGREVEESIRQQTTPVVAEV
jgi:AcrR family transcriptional regulator